MKFVRLLATSSLIPFWLTSCVSIQHKSISEITPLTAKDRWKLNGHYANYTQRTEEKYYRKDGHATPGSFWNDVDGVQAGETVEIEFISEKKVQLSLWEGRTFIAEKVIKGKFKNGYFYSKPVFFVIPFPPISFGHHVDRLRIGLSNDDVVVDRKLDVWLFVLIAGRSQKVESSSIFPRQKEL